MYNHHEESKQTKGPMRTRKFTDIFCLIIFIAFWVLIGYIAIFAYSKGQYSNIAKTIDADGWPCGEADRKAYPLLYVDDPTSVKFYAKTVCVKACPTSSDSTVEFYPNKYKHQGDTLDVRKSLTLFGRLCVPYIKNVGSLIKNNINMSYTQEFLEDISEVWPMILVGLLVCMLIVVMYLFFIRCCTKAFIYILVFMFLAGLILFGLFCWKEYHSLLNKNVDLEKLKSEGSVIDYNDPSAQIKEQDSTDYGKDQAAKWKTAAIIFWVLAGIFFLVILLLCGRIALAAKIMESAAEFVRDEPSVFKIPFFYGFMLLVFFAFWIPTLTLLCGVGELRTNPKSIFMEIIWEDTTKIYVGILAFALLWGISFNFSQETFSIAAMSSSWYFDKKFGNPISASVAICWSFTYHVGTLAFGSLLIAIVWVIQLVLSYIYQKLKEVHQQDTAVGFLIKCAGCFVACFERTLKFINKHAYIETALRNLSFCPAAAQCLQVTTSNFLRFGVLAGITEIFLFMGSLLITCLTTFIMHFVIQGYAQARNVEVDTIGPVSVIFLMSLSISIIFSHVYEISADTMLHCYILDEEDGSIDRGIGGHRPQVLHQTIQHHCSTIKHVHNDEE